MSGKTRSKHFLFKWLNQKFNMYKVYQTIIIKDSGNGHDKLLERSMILILIFDFGLLVITDSYLILEVNPETDYL